MTGGRIPPENGGALSRGVVALASLSHALGSAIFSFRASFFASRGSGPALVVGQFGRLFDSLPLAVLAKIAPHGAWGNAKTHVVGFILTGIEQDTTGGIGRL